MKKDNEENNDKLDFEKYGVPTVVEEFTVLPEDFKERKSELEKVIDDHKELHSKAPEIIYIQTDDRVGAKLEAMLLAEVLGCLDPKTGGGYISLVPLQLKDAGYSAVINLVTTPKYKGAFIHIENISDLEKERESVFKEMLDEILLHYKAMGMINGSVDGFLCLSGEKPAKEYNLPENTLEIKYEDNLIDLTQITKEDKDGR